MTFIFLILKSIIAIAVTFHLYRTFKTAYTIKKIKALGEGDIVFWRTILSKTTYQDSLENDSWVLKGFNQMHKDYFRFLSLGRSFSFAIYIWNERGGEYLTMFGEAERDKIFQEKGSKTLVFNKIMSAREALLTQNALKSLRENPQSFSSHVNQVYDGIQYWIEINPKVGAEMKKIYDDYWITQKANVLNRMNCCCSKHKIRPEVVDNKMFGNPNQAFASWLVCPECKGTKPSNLIDIKKIIGMIDFDTVSGKVGENMHIRLWDIENETVVYHPIEAVQISLTVQDKVDWIVNAYVDVFSNHIGEKISNIPIYIPKKIHLSENTLRVLRDFEIELIYL